MLDDYATSLEFKDIMSKLALGKQEEPYDVKDGFLLYGNRLYVSHYLHEKVMYESHVSPYTGHRGIQATLKGVGMYFYWPHMKAHI